MGKESNPIFTLESRCFVPVAKFGGGFAGDRRGFSTTADASSRIHATAIIAPSTGLASDIRKYSDTTYGPPLLVMPTAAANGQPAATISAEKRSDGTSLFQMHVSGDNPMMMGVAPDIDNHAAVTTTYQSNGILRVTANFTGDKFPASEWTLRDASGQAVFLGGHMPTHMMEVFTKLWGDAQRPTGTVELAIQLNDKGNFEKVVGAEFKTADGTVIAKAQDVSVVGWNQAITSAITPPGMPAPDVQRAAQIPPPESSQRHDFGR